MRAAAEPGGSVPGSGSCTALTVPHWGTELKSTAADRGDTRSPQALYEDWHLRALRWAPHILWESETGKDGCAEWVSTAPHGSVAAWGWGLSCPHTACMPCPQDSPPAHLAAAAGPQTLSRGQAVSSKGSPGSSAPVQSPMVPMHPVALPCPRVCGHTPEAQIPTRLCHGAHGCRWPGPSAHGCCQGQPNPLLPLQPVVAAGGGRGHALTPTCAAKDGEPAQPGEAVQHPNGSCRPHTIPAAHTAR